MRGRLFPKGNHLYFNDSNTQNFVKQRSEKRKAKSEKEDARQGNVKQ